MNLFEAHLCRIYAVPEVVNFSFKSIIASAVHVCVIRLIYNIVDCFVTYSLSTEHVISQIVLCRNTRNIVFYESLL